MMQAIDAFVMQFGLEPRSFYMGVGVGLMLAGVFILIVAMSIRT